MKHKRLLSFLLALLLAVQYVPFANAAEAASYEIGDREVTVEETFEVAVAISGNPGIISLRFKVVYDETALKLVSVADQGLLKGFTTPSPTIASPYTLRWADSLATADNTAEGAVVVLTFQALRVTETEVSIEHTEARTYLGEKVSFANDIAAITILEAPCEHPQKTEVPREEPTCTQTGHELYYTCSCGAVLAADGVTETTVEAQTIPSLGHDWADATCTQARLCQRSGCGAEEGAALGHEWKEEKRDSAHLKEAAVNCTQYNTYWYDCTRCETVSDTAYFTSTEAGPHSFTQKIEDEAHLVAGSGVDCQDAKVYYFDCEYCAEMGTETFVSEKTGDHVMSEQWTTEGGKHFHVCTVEGCDYTQDAENCFGGTANCLEAATCSVCGQKYGELGDHELTHHTRKEADHYQPGHIEHWTCDVCGKYFGDASAQNEITEEETVLNVIPHSHGSQWEMDENQHWNACECGDRINVFDHNYDNSCDTDCNTCGYVREITHSWETEYSHSETEHWIACAVCGEKKDVQAHHGGTATCLTLAVCQDCGQEYGSLGGHALVHHERVEADHYRSGNIEYWFCQLCGKYFADAVGEQEISQEDTVLAVIPHSYSEDWTKDEHQHWHACGCGDKTGVENHVYDNACDTTCDTCGYTRSITHSWESSLQYNETHHWIACSVCGEKKEEQPHGGGTATCTAQAVCNSCSQPYGEPDSANHTAEPEWTQTETHHSSAYPCCGAAAVESEAHSFDQGVCVSCQYARSTAKIGSTVYSTLGKALEAAKSEEKVILLMDTAEETVVLSEGITLDLAGFALTAEYLVAFRDNGILDSAGTGILHCENVRLDKENPMMPVWVDAEEGYRFFAIKSQQKYRSQGAEGFTFIAKPVLGVEANDGLMAQTETNGLSIKMRLNWTSKSGKAVEQFFTLTGEDTKAIYSNSNKIIQLTVSGAGAFAGALYTTTYIESDTGVVWVAPGKLYTGE